MISWLENPLHVTAFGVNCLLRQMPFFYLLLILKVDHVKVLFDSELDCAPLDFCILGWMTFVDNEVPSRLSEISLTDSEWLFIDDLFDSSGRFVTPCLSLSKFCLPLVGDKLVFSFLPFYNFEEDFLLLPKLNDISEDSPKSNATENPLSSWSSSDRCDLYELFFACLCIFFFFLDDFFLRFIWSFLPLYSLFDSSLFKLVTLIPIYYHIIILLVISNICNAVWWEVQKYIQIYRIF